MPENDFAIDLKRACTLAALAPSSHNSQPWALVWIEQTAMLDQLSALIGHSFSDSKVLVLAIDRERELSGLAAHRVEMNVSCGLFLQLLLETLRTHWRPSLVWYNEEEEDEFSGHVPRLNKLFNQALGYRLLGRREQKSAQKLKQRKWQAYDRTTLESELKRADFQVDWSQPCPNDLLLLAGASAF
jgi:nitroreductase